MRNLIDKASTGTLSWEDEHTNVRATKRANALKELGRMWTEDAVSLLIGRTIVSDADTPEWQELQPALVSANPSDVFRNPGDASVDEATRFLGSGIFAVIRKTAPMSTAETEWAVPSRDGSSAAFRIPKWEHTEPVRNLVLVQRSQLNEVQVAFERLADEWEDATWAYSFPERKVMHRAYQRIIGMGEVVVPLILDRLQTRGPDHWFWALEMIQGENPASGSETMEQATEAWLRWGRDKSLA